MWSATMIALSAACCFLCGWIAEERGRCTKAWVWLGAIFGPFALLLVATLPPHGRETSRPT
jgi:hypothetical protein